MINERLKRILQRDRPSIAITVRMPEGVLGSLKTIAAMRGFADYQTLVRTYISEGLRRDEAQLDQHTAQRLAEALKPGGVLSHSA